MNNVEIPVKEAIKKVNDIIDSYNTPSVKWAIIAKKIKTIVNKSIRKR